jgi:hypothetical protein
MLRVFQAEESISQMIKFMLEKGPQETPTALA